MKAGLQLTVLALVAVITIGVVSAFTKEAIEAGQQRMLAHRLADVVPPALRDEDWLENRFQFQHPALGSEKALDIFPVIHVGRWNGAAITAVVPDGYAGHIRLLIAIAADNRLLGVRVLDHRETPGLGDDIERRKSDWITTFNNQSLNAMAKPLWTVKKDGGAFDQFTGATITPRAVVRTVYRVLDWYAQEGQTLLRREFEGQGPRQ